MKLFFTRRFVLPLCSAWRLRCFAENAPLSVAETFAVSTKNFVVTFEVGGDGTAFTNALGGNASAKLLPGLKRIRRLVTVMCLNRRCRSSADGNTSTALQFDSFTKTNDATGREFGANPFTHSSVPVEVTLDFPRRP